MPLRLLGPWLGMLVLVTQITACTFTPADGSDDMMLDSAGSRSSLLEADSDEEITDYGFTESRTTDSIVISFAARDARLSPNALRILRAFVATLRKEPLVPIQLHAYAERSGGQAARTLALRRAKVLFALLLREGIPRSRLRPLVIEEPELSQDRDSIVLFKKSCCQGLSRRSSRVIFSRAP